MLSELACKRMFLIILLFFPLKGAIRERFGGWNIDRRVFDYIREILPEKKTILELGSGWSSGQLSKHYTVYSIENNTFWLNRYNTNYIYAPIKDNWYDADILKNELPPSYDLILVDGPHQGIGRGEFLTHLDLFNTDVPIIFDDVNRKAEYDLMINVARKLKREYKIFRGESGKQFGILLS